MTTTTEIPNIRFWTYTNGDFVKITLRPDQELSHHEGGPTEEGFHSCFTTWAHAHDCVQRYWYSRSRDCDGLYTSQGECEAPVADLRKNTPYGGDGDPAIMLPEWGECRSETRDHTAEAAGY